MPNTKLIIMSHQPKSCPLSSQIFRSFILLKINPTIIPTTENAAKDKTLSKGISRDKISLPGQLTEHFKNKKKIRESNNANPETNDIAKLTTLFFTLSSSDIFFASSPF